MVYSEGGDFVNDEAIIELLFARQEDVISAIDTKYGSRCRKISMGILGNEHDVEECINDAYMNIWETVPPEKPNPLSSYIYKTIRNISINKKRNNNTLKRSCVLEEALEEMENSLIFDSEISAALEWSELMKLIEEFLRGESKENRIAFIRRYWFMESYDEIAKKLGVSKTNVSVRLTRTREKLKKFLKERWFCYE
ncbi:MAG: sigma-70 family RNA polymerase sigma factor [Clostridia bacterium]|nr:sigma-70 family RNA polymerase sigma factor [Clostridia bacterium]